MGAYKDFLIGVEELIYTAMEKGFNDTDGIYAYVYMYEPRADRQTVRNILDDIANHYYGMQLQID